MGSKKREHRKNFLNELLGKEIGVEVSLFDEERNIKISRRGLLLRMNNGKRQGFYVNTSEGPFQIPIIYLSLRRSTRKPGVEKITVELPKGYDLNSLQTY